MAKGSGIYKQVRKNIQTTARGERGTQNRGESGYEIQKSIIKIRVKIKTYADVVLVDQCGKY